MIRVLIADNQTLLREGIISLMKSIPDIDVVWEGSSLFEMVKKTLDLKPDVVVMDLGEGMDGLQAIREIKAHLPDQPILVLSNSNESEIALQVIRSGAIGYLLINSKFEQLVQGIRCISKGESYIQPSILNKIILKISKSSSHQPTSAILSTREKEVAFLVGKGYSNKKIAKTLVLSERTIDAHVSSNLKKLQLSNRTQIALITSKESWGKTGEIEHQK